MSTLSRSSSSRFLLFTVLAVSILLAPFTTVSAQSEAGQSQTRQYCPIVGLPAAEPVVDTVDDVANTLSGEVIIVNPTQRYIPGTRIGLAVYSDSSDTVPMYWTNLPGTVVLPPQDRTTATFTISLEQIPAGDYNLRAFVAQGENELFATALKNASLVVTRDFTKSSPGTPSQLDVAVEGGVLEGDIITLSTSSVPTTFTVASGEATSPVKLLVNQYDLPLGDAVYLDETATGDTTYDVDLPSGRYTAYAYPVESGVLTPVSAQTVLIGDTTKQWIPIYPYLSVIGLTEHPIVDGTEATACIANYSPTNYLISIPAEPVKIEFQVLNEAGQVVDSKEPQTPRLQNFATFSLSSIGPKSQFNAILSTDRVQDIRLSEPTFGAVQTLSFAHQCGDECDLTITETLTDFTQEKTFLTSFWFYLGIVLAAALLMLLMLRRLNERQIEEQSFDYQSPDELR